MGATPTTEGTGPQLIVIMTLISVITGQLEAGQKTAVYIKFSAVSQLNSDLLMN
jgi:hypothetical protein